MRVDESWEARVCMRVFSTVMSWSNEDESWWELRSERLYESFLNYHVLVKRGWELMRVEKREFVWEFSQLSCPGQTRMRVDESWEAKVCMRVFLTIMSWSNEGESWWELRSESLYESFLNCHVLVKRGWELMRVEKRKFVWSSFDLCIIFLSYPASSNDVYFRTKSWKFKDVNGLKCNRNTKRL